MRNTIRDTLAARAAQCSITLSLAFVFLSSGFAPEVALANALSTEVGARPAEKILKKVIQNLGEFPLTFEANEGQFANSVEFAAWGAGYTIYLTTDETVFSLARMKQADESAVAVSPDITPVPPEMERIIIRIKLDGARAPTAIVAEELRDWRSNYFIGKDKSRWRIGVPGFGRVRYEEVYPGIDVEYYGNQQRLEYDFIVAPGANPDAIILSFDGTEKLSVDEDGNLVLHVPGGKLVQHAPIVYQETDRGRESVAGGYTLRQDGKVGFQLAAYDRTRPLVIDPILVYATYLGTDQFDHGRSIAVDSTGAAYIAMETIANDFPNPGAGGIAANRGVVIKLTPDGSSPAYVTYLATVGFRQLGGIAVDDTGAAYVVGATRDRFLPTTPGAFQPTHGGQTDAFLMKLHPSGSSLLYATYMGGSSGDVARDVTLDATGVIYVTGFANSADFPVTIPTLVPKQSNTFIVKIDPANSGAVYSRIVGGDGGDFGNSIAVDDVGAVYVAGETLSPDFPVTAGAAQTSRTAHPIFGFQHAEGFVFKLDSSGNNVVYATYLGGNHNDTATGIAVDSTGAAYVTGTTRGTDFPVTSGAFRTTFPTDNSLDDASVFVTKVDPSGSSFAYSTFIGLGNEPHIALDADNSAYITGWTQTLTFPVTPDALQPQHGAGFFSVNAFLVTLDAAGSTLTYGTFLGGPATTFAADLALDAQGGIYISGEVWSPNFPATEDAFQSTFGGGNFDGFFLKLGPDNQPPVADAGADQIAEATSAAGASVTLDGSGSTDPDGDPLTYSWTGPFGTATGVSPTVTVPLGVHIVTLEVSDGTESGTDTVQVTAQDTTPPLVTPPADITAEAEGPLTAVALGTATATDLVDGTLTPTPDKTGPFALGTHIVTWTATDAAGNTGTAIQQVTVRDTTPPLVTPPADITAEAEGPLTAVDLGTATATDLVDGTLTPTPDNTGPFAPGVHTVTWSATDAAGNTGTATQTVTIRYIFNGFHQPLENLPVINTAKAGQVVPVKWSVPTPSGDFIRNTAIVTGLQMAPASCDPEGAVPEDLVDAEGTGSAGVRYDATTEEFIFNWKTSKDMAGSCHVFVLTLNDGSTHTAKFKLK